MKVKQFILLLSAWLLCQGLQATAEMDVVNNYAKLLHHYNQSESLEVQAARIDQYLKHAKGYLKENPQNDQSDEYQLIEGSVYKLKAFQLLFNRQQQQLTYFSEIPEYQEFLKIILAGAMNSSPNLTWKEQSNLSQNYDREILDLANLSNGLSIHDLFPDHRSLEGASKENAEVRLQFLASMISDSKLKNQLAAWTLQFVFEGRTPDCRYIDQQVNQRCHIIRQILDLDQSFTPVDYEELIGTIMEYREEAKRALKEELQRDEMFSASRDQSTIRRVNLPPIEKRFPKHLAALTKIKNLRAIQILRAEKQAQKVIAKLTTPMITLHCEMATYPALRNCGYKLVETTAPALSIGQSINNLKQQIVNEENRLQIVLTHIQSLRKRLNSKIKLAGNNYLLAQEISKEKNIGKEIDGLIIKEIQIRPQSFGAALMDHPQFIPSLSSSLLRVIDTINTKELKENLISIGVIAALIGTSFVTAPVGVAAGLVITVYEMIHYNGKYAEYEVKRNTTAIEMIEYQYKDLNLSREEFNILEQRFSAMQKKMEYYQMNSYLAAAGLITAPIALGHFIDAGGGKFAAILENFKFAEKWTAQFSSSSKMNSRVQKIMHLAGIEHPDQLLTAMMKLRRYIQEARNLSEVFLIHRLHHLLKRPEQLHLTERSFAGAQYLKKAMASKELEKDILQLLLEIESTPTNYFAE